MKTITINLTTVRIDSISIMPLPLRVTVRYTIFDEHALEYKRAEVTFWKEFPQGESNPNWLQLPSKYVGSLESLANDALAALESREL